MNQKFKDVFQEPPILAFRRNRNLHDPLEGKNFIDGKLQILSKKKNNWVFHQVLLKIGKLML